MLIDDRQGRTGERANAPREVLEVYVDVTDAVSTPWAAGIQRVVRKLLRHLGTEDRIALVPMIWSVPLSGYRHLTDAERSVLFSDGGSTTDSNGTAPKSSGLRWLLSSIVSVVRPVLGRVRRGATGLLARAGLKDPLFELVRRVGLATVNSWQHEMAVGPLPSGSVLLELDAVWNVVRVDRAALYQSLRERGVRVAALLYDLLPQQHPEWFDPPVVGLSDRVLRAVAEHADTVVAISRHTADSFTAWAAQQGLHSPEPSVVTLGADAVRHRRAGGVGSVPVSGRYLLVVGTVEPRKNHRTLLDAHKIVAADHPDLELVVVGRAGWRNDAVVERLAASSTSGGSVHWLADVDDETLSALYSGAFLVAVPSITEGYGLPVVEALAHGVPVVSSNGGALPEAGGDMVDYVDPLDVQGWAAAIGKHLRDSDHHQRMRRRAGTYRAAAWADTARSLADVLLAPGPEGARR